MGAPEPLDRPRRFTLCALLLAAILMAGCAPSAMPAAHASSPSAAPSPLVPMSVSGPRPQAIDTAAWSRSGDGVVIGVRRFSVLGALSPAMLEPDIALALDRRGAVTWMDETTAQVATDDGAALVRITGRELTIAEANCDTAACHRALETTVRELSALAAKERRYLMLGSNLSLALPTAWHVLDPRSGGTLLRDSEPLDAPLRAAVAERVGFSLDPRVAYYPQASLLMYAVATRSGLDGGEVALDMALRRYVRATDQTIDTFAATAPSHIRVVKLMTAAGEALEVTRADGPRREVDHILFIGDASYLFRFSASARTPLDLTALRAIVGSLVASTALIANSGRGR